MTNSYSLPAAANYHSPPPHHHHAMRQRGYRICDQCGSAETPNVPRFRFCGGCKITQYCSTDCQKQHWPSHKPICQHTAAQLKQHSAYAQSDDLLKNLRKFTSAHSSLLGWAGFQALQLKRLPANVRLHALLVELSPHNHAESHRRFSIAGARVVPRSYVSDPEVVADIQRREDRCRQNGGIGAAVVILQCGGVSQVMPVEVDPPAKISWDSRTDWAEVLRHFVDSGRTDFKPISSTPKGVVYGY
jgi:hypothetical protein